MRINRRTIAVIALLCAVLAVMALGRREPEPEYKGRNLTAWLDDFLSQSPTAQDNAVEAIQNIGVAAVPYLTNILTADTKIHRERVAKVTRLPRPIRSMGFVSDWLGPSDRSQLLALIAIKHLGVMASNTASFVVPLSSKLPAQAHDALMAIGAPSIPALMDGLSSRERLVRLAAVETLGIMGEQSSAKTLGNIELSAITTTIVSAPYAESRAAAARLLGRFGSGTEPVAQVLAAATKDSEAAVRAQAIDALSYLDAPVSVYGPTIAPLLKDADIGVRLAAAKYIARSAEALRENWEAMNQLREDPSAEIRQFVSRTMAQQLRDIP